MKTIDFKTLGLSSTILAALEKKGFRELTPIQQKAIPLILDTDDDLICKAQTGTGKTAAFGLPLIERSLKHSQMQTLIISPTRELALQVCDELDKLKGNAPIKVVPVYGGQPISRQKTQLKKSPQIIVGTPGRLVDLSRSKALNLAAINTIVLDEADEILTAGFIEDIEFILDRSNTDRRTLFFSATLPREIQNLSDQYMKSPLRVEATPVVETTQLTEERFIRVNRNEKFSVLSRILDIEADFYGLIFCKTKKGAEELKAQLAAHHYQIDAMHGDLSQLQRESVLKRFRNRTCQVLIVTDIAARGIDVPQLTHVINYDLPQDPASYTHRIGRTGRAGNKGVAVTFVAKNETGRFKSILKRNPSKVNWVDPPSNQDIRRQKLLNLKTKIISKFDTPVSKDISKLANEILASSRPDEVLSHAIDLLVGDKPTPSLNEDPGFEKPRRHPRRRPNHRSKPFFGNKKKAHAFKKY